jgi:hypothetical protein
MLSGAKSIFNWLVRPLREPHRKFLEDSLQSYENEEQGGKMVLTIGRATGISKPGPIIGRDVDIDRILWNSVPS